MIRWILILACFSFGISGRCDDATSNFPYVFATKSWKAKDFFDSRPQIDLADAIAKGDTNKMHALIAGGADVNHSGHNSMKPLFWALVKQNLKSFRFLLENGADPNVVADRDQQNARSALMLAAGLEDSKYLQELLAHGATPNFFHHYIRETAIFEAAFYGKTNNISILLKNGADIDAKNASGQTPMHKAVNSHAFATALFLYRAGANPLIKDDQNYSSVDTLKKFSNFTYTLADKDAYPQLLEAFAKHGTASERAQTIR